MLRLIGQWLRWRRTMALRPADPRRLSIAVHIANATWI